MNSPDREKDRDMTRIIMWQASTTVTEAIVIITASDILLRTTVLVQIQFSYTFPFQFKFYFKCRKHFTSTLGFRS